MKSQLLLATTALMGTLIVGGCAPAAREGSGLLHPQEKHLRNIRQLTFGGENAEAYFSVDDRQLIFQARQGNDDCDQIYIMNTDGSGKHMVSTGQGRTTCSYFFPDGERIIYSSTHLAGPECPPGRDHRHGYPLYTSYDIFSARADGSDLKRLTSTPGYDAEATISRDGKKIVFTSVRDGDPEIYVMAGDGGNVQRLTHGVGYDGGAFFSFDGSKIVYRAYHPTDPEETARYKAALEQGLIGLRRLEIFVMDADGSNKRQITNNGAISFAPFFHPDGKRIIFASNLADPKGHSFDLYIINIDGSGLEQITYYDGFDSFPMFSSDGKRLVFASNRQLEAGAPRVHNARVSGETNVFIADWVE